MTYCRSYVFLSVDWFSGDDTMMKQNLTPLVPDFPSGASMNGTSLIKHPDENHDEAYGRDAELGSLFPL